MLVLKIIVATSHKPRSLLFARGWQGVIRTVRARRVGSMYEN
jgi:hypothetical protein